MKRRLPVYVPVLSALMAAMLCAAPVRSEEALGLEDLVRSALRANPSLQEARHRVLAAAEAIDEARSYYWPALYTTAGYARTDNPPQAFMMTLNQRALDMRMDFNDPDDTDNLRLTAGARYLLLDGGQRRLQRDMAGRGRDTAQAQQLAVRNELIHLVTRGYYGTLQAQAFVAVQEERVLSLEESRRVAEERFQAGSAVRTDVLNLDVQLAQAREDLIRARNGLKRAVAALNTAVGEPVVALNQLPSPPADAHQSAPTPEDSGGLTEHPVLAARRALTGVRELEYVKARRDYAPSVSAFGTLDWDSDVSTDFENSYFVGVEARWDVFTGFRRGATVRQAEARRSAARAAEQAARNQLELDLTEATLAGEEARERLEVNEKSVQSAEEALRITRRRYEGGAAGITELLTAQVGLTAVRTRQVAARYDYLIAVSNLERAKGTLAYAFQDEERP